MASTVQLVLLDKAGKIVHLEERDKALMEGVGVIARQVYAGERGQPKNMWFRLDPLTRIKVKGARFVSSADPVYLFFRQTEIDQV